MTEKNLTDEILLKNRLIIDAVRKLLSRYNSFLRIDEGEASIQSALEDLERLSRTLGLFDDIESSRQS